MGICGGLVTTRLMNQLKNAGTIIPENILSQLQESMENLLQAEFQALIPESINSILQQVVLDSVFTVFIIVFTVSLINLALSVCLPHSTLKNKRD